MDGVIRIGDHFLDENEGYESDQLRDDYAEHEVPEPLDPTPSRPPWPIADVKPNKTSSSSRFASHPWGSRLRDDLRFIANLYLIGSEERDRATDLGVINPLLAAA
jgi:hypothetical protein